MLQEDLATLRRRPVGCACAPPTRPPRSRCSTAGSSTGPRTSSWSAHDDPAALNARLVAADVRVTELAPVRRTLEEIVLAASERR